MEADKDLLLVAFEPCNKDLLCTFIYAKEDHLARKMLKQEVTNDMLLKAFRIGEGWPKPISWISDSFLNTGSVELDRDLVESGPKREQLVKLVEAVFDDYLMYVRDTKAKNELLKRPSDSDDEEVKESWGTD